MGRYILAHQLGVSAGIAPGIADGHRRKLVREFKGMPWFLEVKGCTEEAGLGKQDFWEGSSGTFTSFPPEVGCLCFGVSSALNNRDNSAFFTGLSEVTHALHSAADDIRHVISTWWTDLGLNPSPATCQLWAVPVSPLRMCRHGWFWLPECAVSDQEHAKHFARWWSWNEHHSVKVSCRYCRQFLALPDRYSMVTSRHTYLWPLISSLILIERPSETKLWFPACAPEMIFQADQALGCGWGLWLCPTCELGLSPHLQEHCWPIMMQCIKWVVVT